MLSEAQITELRALLEADRHRRLTSAHDAASFSRDRDRTRMGRDSIDESAEEAMYGTKLRLADRENGVLDEISQSLRRLDEGRLDQCEDCDEEIGFARLKARPTSRVCVACQEDREEDDVEEQKTE